jgi:hypothetical protein
VVNLPVALADNLRRNLCSGCLMLWQNMLAYQSSASDLITIEQVTALVFQVGSKGL